MRCEEIDYQIHGNDLQVRELDPGETVIAEAGAMNWMGDPWECPEPTQRGPSEGPTGPLRRRLGWTPTGDHGLSGQHNYDTAY